MGRAEKEKKKSERELIEASAKGGSIKGEAGAGRIIRGKIIKGIGGFYYIHAVDGRLYSTRAKGIFRNIGVKPLAGDNVEMEILDDEKLEGSLTGIDVRKNVLIRPPVANIDQALIIFAVREPDPNLNLLDRFLIYMGMQDIPTVIYFNKADLDRGGLLEKYRKMYEAAGYQVICGSANASPEETLAQIRSVLQGKTTVLAGPSGVGKSSLTNLIYGGQKMEVGELSEKIKRGKQTTRHTELFAINEESFVLDTPGFTSLYVQGVPSDRLRYYYEEFAPYTDDCRFNGCSHVHEAEKICAVRQAVSRGEIAAERYENYCQIYEEVKQQEKTY